MYNPEQAMQKMPVSTAISYAFNAAAILGTHIDVKDCCPRAKETLVKTSCWRQARQSACPNRSKKNNRGIGGPM
jgi:hypothetical protein